MPVRGFLLGKFLPPHAGHLFLCEAAASMVEELTVLVCSIDAEPIPGALRAGWMRSLLPECRVLHMHRPIPQTPDEHPDFWAIWRSAIHAYHPEPIDLVFGSEPYLFQLAETLAAEAVLIDPEREVFAVSGTAVRRDPQRHWADIPPPVRPYYQRRITLLGPESSGKSTLAALLADRFASRHMPEYGRTYDAFYRGGTGWTARDFVRLADTHAAMRRALAARAGYLLFEDTDAVQTQVWSELLGAPLALASLQPAFEPADLYLVLSPEMCWRDDGTRYFADGDTRQRFFTRCLDLLVRLRCAHLVVGGSDWQTRATTAVAQVRSWLEAQRPS